MGLLNHLFGSTEAIAKEITADDESIIRHWQHYLSTIPQKGKIAKYLSSHLEAADLQDHLQELKRLLDLELVDIFDEEIGESELISDLNVLEHDQKIKRVHRLEQCLRYVETRYEYVYGLLQKLHSTLQSQMHLVVKIQQNSAKTEILLGLFNSQLELEQEILQKIHQIKSFHALFLALIKGEHIVRTMDLKEKRLLKKMEGGLRKAFLGEIKEGINYEWTMMVLNSIEDRIRESEAFSDYHYDVQFEFVNHPEFVELVRESIAQLKKGGVSGQMINVFVHLFREWYNHERD